MAENSCDKTSATNSNFIHVVSTTSRLSEHFNIKTTERIEKTSKQQEIFRKGTGFNEYEELIKAIQAYQTINHISLYKRDSRSIESIISSGRSPKKKISTKLKYGEISYRCKFGGKVYKSFSKGLRPKQRLFCFLLFLQPVDH